VPPDLVVVVFGLVAAASWGTADFSGGLASRRAAAIAVVIASQLLGIVVAAAAATIRGEALPGIADVLWAGAAGSAGGVALVAFYRGLAVGRVSTVAPIAGVLAAAVPVAVGAVLEGVPGVQRAAGIGLALVAVVLVSAATSEDALPGGPDAGRRSVVYGTLGGIGFGLFYVFIDRVAAGLIFWPLVASRAASLTTVSLVAVATRTSFTGLRAAAPLIVVAGVLDVGGNAGFLLAAQAGRLDVASVLASLYPVMTVLLAIVVLRERVGPRHALGMAAALGAVVLIGGR
jgi:drug/metabolite transporter (DMT)-like permease